jgi:outer membrane protein OmpA-like peptidoglycan-associated protein
MSRFNQHRGPIGIATFITAAATATLAQSIGPAFAQPIAQPITQPITQPIDTTIAPTYTITVTSNQDTIAPDDRLTLREAIELSNGTLSPTQLSPAEQQQVNKPGSISTIRFNLPAGQTVIALTRSLPDLIRPMTIDGTSQPGYDPNTRLFEQNADVRRPIVEITPAPGIEILRGLTITSDRVTIRGLSLYGFNSSHGLTASTPPADIFISHTNPPPDISQQQPPADNAPFNNIPPKDILIEQNWLGIKPDRTMPDRTSAFGISVFNSSGTHIEKNWIANHDGSAIITSVSGENTHIKNNIITSNGLAGMPDAIRLEGKINGSHIARNHICGNDGSGLYLFKPEGSADIHDNSIVFNGRRLRRAAIYVTGNQHKIHNNTIQNQTAAGVVVGSNPKSTGNQIYNNQFAALEGLSIDLNTNHNSDVADWQNGDGLNPDRNSPNRRNDTGNAAINAPVFTSRKLALNETTITGNADMGTTIELYRIKTKTRDAGPLETPIAQVKTDANGRFSTTVDGLTDGDRLSAIAHHPDYGTSEPAINARIGTATPGKVIPNAPVCLSPPKPPKPPEKPPEIIRLKVPRNIHFALDKDFISPRSAQILDRIAEVLIANPNLIIELHGHTDPRASDDYNIDLGKRRANNTRKYLLKKGIDSSRMTIRTFGERQRLSDGSGKVDYARDRRTEVIFKDIRDIEVIVQEDDLQIEE